jgi:hypothetical protein
MYILEPGEQKQVEASPIVLKIAIVYDGGDISTFRGSTP